ncbi:Universal stress protein [Candidatus Methanoperedenaceae archaeon GB37]|nr:Universal stress protein [Candidatus Methanoperedenaceae archaeon GB37]
MVSEVYRKILVATDGSAHTEKAVRYAVELARLAEAEILALHVVDTTAFTGIPMDATWESMYELLFIEGSNATKRVAEIASNAGVEVEEKMLEGHPAEEIMRVGEEVSADLIVMGSIGKSGLDRFLLGSVADKVARNSKIPVMVVRN